MGDGGIVRRPAVPSPVRIRRDINLLSASDPIVDFYRQAIGVMKTRPLRDPTSWRYQSAIHDYPLNVATTAARRNDPRNPDPLAIDADNPFPPDRDTFWRQCQHGGWFFLSWHRMYLHFFEKMVMNAVASLGGPTDWALPYWNYSVSATAALLPPPFRNEFMPNGSRNDLWVRERTPNANLGQPFLGPADTDLACLRVRPFAVSFGGPMVMNHPPAQGGALEGTPHNAVHGALGGAGGFMGGFSTAPLDPMFWLHHANIDRLWEVWVQRHRQLGVLVRNPRDGAWLTQPFDFRDAAGNVVSPSITSQQVLNTRLPPLSYEYEDTSDPFNGAP